MRPGVFEKAGFRQQVAAGLDTDAKIPYSNRRLDLQKSDALRSLLTQAKTKPLLRQVELEREKNTGIGTASRWAGRRIG